MIRKIITIDKEKCNGCGLCVKACHEGAIGMVEGVATLLRDDYCDGLGDCLPSCPMDAIHFIKREAAPYDEDAVLANQKKKEALAEKYSKKSKEKEILPPLACGCPGSSSKSIQREKHPCGCVENHQDEIKKPVSQLGQWPVQIKLAPVNAPYFKDANLLIAADCTAYAYGNFHEDFIKNKITLIGCPKLDGMDYAEKLGEIFKLNDIKKVTVTRMEVPCCKGIVTAVERAIINSGKEIPLEICVIGTAGEIVEIK